MVCIVKYNDSQEVVGCTREDGASGGLDFLQACKDLELEIVYKTQTELDSNVETIRVSDITSKATSIIEIEYSPLKQRKMLSIAVALMDKVNQGGILTEDEEALMQSNRNANAEITAIRAIENTAIADGILLADINWTI